MTVCPLPQIPATGRAGFPDPARDIAPGDGSIQSIVLAGGCFWCVEAVYRALAGVSEVVSGYAGGTAETADYRTVCSGLTDHAEVVRITYDPARTSFGQILKIFFSVAHDPTQVDRQGNDVGRQYRSAIFYQGEEQRAVAADYIDQINRSALLDGAVATTLEPLRTFFPAEAYHQDYAARNPAQPYIRAVSAPKVAKFRAVYPALQKSGE